MTTFVLVHGAWTGAHVWRQVRTRLWRRGHDTFTPTLTGLGARTHLAHPDLGLDTHIRDVLGVLTYEDLRDVVLVGHSYGGAVALAAASRAPRRIAHLVLLDALLPHDGESVQDLRRHRTPPGEPIPPPWFRDADPARLARLLAASRLSMQPPRTFHDPVELPDTGEPVPFRRSYVRAARRAPSAAYDAAAERARHDPGWSSHSIEAAHDVMLEAPDELVDLLCALAGDG
ncbi:alpha/beta hydrolase family protein [Catellatospora sp. NPDC049111]|uniref:alpha/beta fold hydrolase n=1 Tax=Catellatospora sp. NPDC049111 TaxID=3155271 RepID=UPI0033DA8831